MAGLIQDPDHIPLQEEDNVQALLGKPPGWMLYWGITLAFVIVLFLLYIAHLIRYPDIVSAPAVIQTVAPPIRLEAEIDGRVQSLLVADGETVRAGELLMVLQNPASYLHVEEVATVVDTLLQAVEARNIDNVVLPTAKQLGALQPAYAQLATALTAQQYLLQQDDASRRVALLKRQIGQLGQLSELLRQELDTLREEVKLARRNRDIYKQLWQDGAASEEQWEEKDMRYLSYQRQIQTKERELIQQQVQISKLREQIIQLEQQDNDELAAGWTALQETARRLRGEIQQWQDKYLLIAPIAGQVSLAEVWSPNQPIHQQEVLVTILPTEKHSEVIARARLSLYRSGKVEVGQTVFLRLHAYPYKEFGSLEGKVQQISPLPEALDVDGPAYQVIISLMGTDTLYTTHQQPIPFQQELNAQARIITADRSFLARILDPILSKLRPD